MTSDPNSTAGIEKQLDSFENGLRDFTYWKQNHEDRLKKIEEWSVLVRLVQAWGWTIVLSLVGLVGLLDLGVAMYVAWYYVPQTAAKYKFDELQKRMEASIKTFDKVTDFLGQQQVAGKTLQKGARTATFDNFIPDNWVGIVIVSYHIDDQHYGSNIFHLDGRIPSISPNIQQDSPCIATLSVLLPKDTTPSQGPNFVSIAVVPTSDKDAITGSSKW